MIRMVRKKITVRKKGYWRKGYVRKDKTRVKKTYVPPTTYKMRDLGKPGKTPERKKWFKVVGKSGFKKDKSLAWNYKTVKRNTKGNLLRAGRRLIALANVTIDKPTKRKARILGKRFLVEHKKNK